MYLVFWELAKGRPLKTMIASEKPDKSMSIVSISFLQTPNDIITHDSQGVTYLHSLVKMMLVWTVNSTILFAGKKPTSTIVNIEPLPLSSDPFAYLRLQGLLGKKNSYVVWSHFSATEADASTQQQKPTSSGTASLQSADGSYVAPQPPVLPNAQWTHPTDMLQLVATLTPFKLIVISTRPTVSVVYKHLKPKAVPLTALPCAAWRPVHKSEETGALVPPVLAFAFGRQLILIQMNVVSSGPEGHKVKIDKLNERLLKFSIMSLQWLSSRVCMPLSVYPYFFFFTQLLAVLSNREELFLLDAGSLTLVSSPLPLRDIQLVYQSHFGLLAPKKDAKSVSGIVLFSVCLFSFFFFPFCRTTRRLQSFTNPCRYPARVSCCWG